MVRGSCLDIRFNRRRGIGGLSCNAAGRTTLPYYFIGWVVLLSYLGFYWYRKRVEDKRAAPVEASSAAAGPAGAGTITASTGEGASP